MKQQIIDYFTQTHYMLLDEEWWKEGSWILPPKKSKFVTFCPSWSSSGLQLPYKFYKQPSRYSKEYLLPYLAQQVEEDPWFYLNSITDRITATRYEYFRSSSFYTNDIHPNFATYRLLGDGFNDMVLLLDHEGAWEFFISLFNSSGTYDADKLDAVKDEFSLALQNMQDFVWEGKTYSLFFWRELCDVVVPTQQGEVYFYSPLGYDFAVYPKGYNVSARLFDFLLTYESNQEEIIQVGEHNISLKGVGRDIDSYSSMIVNITIDGEVLPCIDDPIFLIALEKRKMIAELAI